MKEMYPLEGWSKEMEDRGKNEERPISFLHPTPLEEVEETNLTVNLFYKYEE